MTLNEARDRLVAADKRRRSINVSADVWYWSHYADGEPGQRETTFRVHIAGCDECPMERWSGHSLDGVLALALVYLGGTDMPADVVAEAAAEGVQKGGK